MSALASFAASSNLSEFRRAEFLPFSRPDISEAEIEAVGEVLRSGWITTGPNAARFENEIARYCGASGAIALASATAGMHLMMESLALQAGDEVITPSLTWVSTPNMIVKCGGKPVWVDVERDTLLVSPQAVEAAITPRTRAIIPVHYAGVPADLDGLREVAQRHDLPLIEDAAHAIGTEYRGTRIGARGTAIFSFHPIKNLTTGEGGASCSDDANLLNRIRSAKFHGLAVDAFDRETLGRAPQAEVIEPGFKYNLTDIAAVLGLGQLARLDEFIARRGEIAHQLGESLADIEEIRPLSVPDYPHRHAWHLFIVRVDNARLSRDEFMAELKARNIGTGLHFRAAHTQKYFRENFPGQNLPHTEWNSERICSLPLFPTMTEDDVRDVARAVKAVLARR